MKISKSNRKLIKELSLKDKKTLLEKTLKLGEENGEVAEAVLSMTKASGCEYKQKNVEDVVEEVTDVVIVALSILYELEKTEEWKKSTLSMNSMKNNFDRVLTNKLTKWENKLSKELDCDLDV